MNHSGIEPATFQLVGIVVPQTIAPPLQHRYGECWIFWGNIDVLCVILCQNQCRVYVLLCTKISTECKGFFLPNSVWSVCVIVCQNNCGVCVLSCAKISLECVLLCAKIIVKCVCYRVPKSALSECVIVCQISENYNGFCV